MPARPPMILVSGGGECNPEVRALAEQVGEEVAQAGAMVLTGGLGGVMEAAARGAKRAGGTTVGIVPGTDSSVANAFIDVVIATGMSHGRNMILVHTADTVIAVKGAFGTLSEIALALVMRKPVVSLGSWQPDPLVMEARDPKESVQLALGALEPR